jgi:pilus assembly protein Flp/PilA
LRSAKRTRDAARRRQSDLHRIVCCLRFPDKGKPAARLGRKAKGRAGVSGGTARLPKGRMRFVTVAGHGSRNGGRGALVVSILSNPAARRRTRRYEAAHNRVEVPMKSLALKVRGFLGSEDGATAVEYAVMVALIIAACIATIGTMGQGVKNTFENVNGTMP